jgi:hypothetical protein
MHLSERELFGESFQMSFRKDAAGQGLCHWPPMAAFLVALGLACPGSEQEGPAHAVERPLGAAERHVREGACLPTGASGGGESNLLFQNVSFVLKESKSRFTSLTPGSPPASFSLPIIIAYRK